MCMCDYEALSYFALGAEHFLSTGGGPWPLIFPAALREYIFLALRFSKKSDALREYISWDSRK